MSNLEFSGFFGQQMRDRVTGMIEALAQYLQAVLRQGSQVLAVEASFQYRQQIDENDVVLTGVIDRLEQTGDGGVGSSTSRPGRNIPTVRHPTHPAGFTNWPTTKARCNYLTPMLRTDRPSWCRKRAIVQVGHEKTDRLNPMCGTSPGSRTPVDPQALIALAAKLLRLLRRGVQRQDLQRKRARTPTRQPIGARSPSERETVEP